MTALHQYQSQVPSLRRPAGVSLLPLLSAAYSGAVSSCAPQLLGHRDPIASRALSFVSRKLACQGQFPSVYSKLLQYICQDRPEGLHRHFRFLQMRSTDGSTTIGKAFADGQKVTVGASKSD